MEKDSAAANKPATKTNTASAWRLPSGPYSAVKVTEGYARLVAKQ